MRPINVTASILASQLRGWSGTMAVRKAAKQPKQPLVLYDIENCPYCRLVREALTELDLDALIQPCPRNGERFRPEVEELGGKQQFPFLVDPNTGTQMYESADIIDYLVRTYGGKLSAQRGLRRSLAVGSSMLASAARADLGLRAKNSTPPKQPLELYSFESSPYSRLVREKMCALELPYLLRNTGKGRWTDLGPPSLRDRVWRAPKETQRNRKRLAKITGRVQVPYLVDPNTGTEMFESGAINRYLEQTYAAG